MLLLSLRSAGVQADDPTTIVVVHVPQDMPDSPQIEELRQLGAHIEPYAPFDAGTAQPETAAYCNKLVQFRTPLLQQAERVLLLDADMLMLQDPRPLFDAEAVRAKIVDFGLPSADRWQPLFRDAGLGMPETAFPDFEPGTPTPARNCNGGMYFLPAHAFAALAESWPRWSRHCLGQSNLLGDRLHHSDQLGFAMAMQELGLPFRPLELANNFPTHLSAQSYSHIAPAQITALHYHWHVDAHGIPAPIGVDWIDRQITREPAASARITASGWTMPRSGNTDMSAIRRLARALARAER